jgi:rubrerythrin
MSDAMVTLLQDWLKAEDDTIEMTNKISATTTNETIRLFMLIVRADSVKHRQIQQFLLDAMTKQAPAISLEEIADISEMINEHLALEQKTVDLGKSLVGQNKLPILKELMQYLLDDEEKHVRLLQSLAAMKEYVHKNT